MMVLKGVWYPPRMLPWCKTLINIIITHFDKTQEKRYKKQDRVMIEYYYINKKLKAFNNKEYACGTTEPSYL